VHLTRATFQQRRDLVVNHLNQTFGLRCAMPAGAFYAFVSCEGLMGRTSPGGRPLRTDEDVATALLEEAHVAVMPGSAFGLGPYLRLSYAVGEEVLAQALAAIRVFCEQAAA
jgi:aspartate aminotransferase